MQTAIVILLVVLSVIYVTRHFIRTCTHKKKSQCSACTKE